MNIFLHPQILELFACIIFQPEKNYIEIDRDFLEGSKRSKLFVFNSLKNFIRRYKLEGHFVFNEMPEKILVSLRDENASIEFLKKYLYNYKTGKLSVPKGGGTYYNYVENLYYMNKVLNHYSQNFQQQTFSINNLLADIEDEGSLFVGKRGRFLEFMLDLYFQYKDSFTIKRCSILKKQYPYKDFYGLHLYLCLKEHPNKITAHLHKLLDDIEFSELQKNDLWSSLDKTELDIVKLNAKDLTSSQIAIKLGYVDKTIKTKLTKIYEKLEIQGDRKGKKESLKELYKKTGL